MLRVIRRQFPAMSGISFITVVKSASCSGSYVMDEHGVAGSTRRRNDSGSIIIIRADRGFRE